MNDSNNPRLQPGDVLTNCLSKSDLEAIWELAQDKLIVVDCYASWCPPCQQIAPVFAALAQEHKDVVFVKVDVEQATQDLKSEVGAWALPTFCFYMNGKKVGSFAGANENLLRRGLESGGKVSMCNALCLIQ